MASEAVRKYGRRSSQYKQPQGQRMGISSADVMGSRIPNTKERLAQQARMETADKRAAAVAAGYKPEDYGYDRNFNKINNQQTGARAGETAPEMYARQRESRMADYARRSGGGMASSTTPSRSDTIPSSIARPTEPKYTGGMIDGKPAGLALREMRLAAEEAYERGEGPKPFGPSAGERRYEAFEEQQKQFAEKQKQFDDYQQTRADAFEATRKEYERRNLIKDAVEGVPSSISRPLEGEELLSPYADSYSKAYQADNKEILDLIASEYGPEAAGREPSNEGAAPDEELMNPTAWDSDVPDLGSTTGQDFANRQEQIEEMYAKGREAVREMIEADQEAQRQASRSIYNKVDMGLEGVGNFARALVGGRPSKKQRMMSGTGYDSVLRARGDGSPEERVAANIKYATERAIAQRQRNLENRPVQDRAKDALEDYRRGFDY